MSQYEYPLVPAFRVTADLIRDERHQFDVIEGFNDRAAELDLAKVKFRADRVGVDVLPAHEAYDLTQEHPQLTKDALEIAVSTLKRLHLGEQDRRIVVDLKNEVGIFPAGDVDLSIGIPLGPSGTEALNQRREIFSGCISAIIGRTIELPELVHVEDPDDYGPDESPREGFVIIGRARIGEDEKLDKLVAEIEKQLFPEYVQGEAYTGPLIDDTLTFYPPEVYGAKVLTFGD